MALIFYPSISICGISKMYKRYLLLGPFFTEERIYQSNMLLVSWKQANQWSAPVNPSLTQYENYFLQVNPSLHYRSSFERDVYEKALIDSTLVVDTTTNEFKFLQSYFADHYVPPDVDSIKMILIRQVRKDFETRVDTLQTIVF